MKLAIITVRRPGEEFVHRSLVSLLSVGGWRDEIHLFIGDRDPAYLADLEAAPRMVLHRLDEAGCAEVAARGLTGRHTYNYCRVLDHFATTGDDLIVCEDDVLYDTGFAGKVGLAVAEMDRIAADYVLSLYCDRDYGADDGLRLGRYISAYPARSFYGTQGLYLPAPTVAAYAPLLRQRGVDVAGRPTDLILADIGDERQNVYLVACSLVQHIGEVSTGLGGFHRSPSFRRPWPWATEREASPA